MNIDINLLSVDLSLTYPQALKLLQIVVDNMHEDMRYEHILNKLVTALVDSYFTALADNKNQETTTL